MASFDENGKKISEQIFEDVIKDDPIEPPKTKFQQKIEKIKLKLQRNPKIKKILNSPKWRKFMKSKFVAKCKELLEKQRALKARMKQRRDKLYDVGENDILPGFVSKNKRYIMWGCSALGIMILTITLLGFIPNHRCDFSNLELVKEPTCYDPGIVQAVCKCGQVKTYPLSTETAHVYGEYHLAVEATCKETGIMEAVCQNCGGTKTKPTDYTLHTYPEWTIDQDATCEKDGLRHRYCSVCNHFVREVIQASGHRYHSVWVPPTAGAEGYSINTCLSCNKTYQSDIVPALGSQGLTFELVEYEDMPNVYMLSDVGTCTDKTIYVPKEYNGIPVTMIGDNAFSKANITTAVVIGSNITNIGYNVFANSSIHTVYYESSYSSPSNLFFANSNIKTVVFTGTIVPAYILHEASNIETIIMRDSVQSVSTHAFSRSGVQNIKFSEELKQIGAEAFSNCLNLKELKWPNVKVLAAGVLNMCTNLEKLYLPATISTLESTSLRGCASLTEIYYAGNTHTWKSVAKASNWDYNTPTFNILCSDGTIHKDGTLDANLDLYFKWTLNADKKSYTIQKFIMCPDEIVVVPKTYHGLPVTHIADGAFEGAKFGNLVILADIRHIGDRAFANCENLISLTIPNSVSTIGEDAFINCKALKTIVLSDNLTFYSLDMFEGCESLQFNKYDTGLYLPSHENEYFLLLDVVDANITSFEFHPNTRFMENVFTNYQFLTELHFPEFLDYIPDNTCQGCVNLTTVTMQHNIIAVGANVFDGCEKLSSIELSECLYIIGDAMFQNCKSLKTIYIPNSVNIISSYAFHGCANLVEVTYTSNSKLTAIGPYAFKDCVFYKNVHLPESLITLDAGVFMGCVNLTNITIPYGVSILSEQLFEGCGFLSVVSITGSLDTIKSTTFKNCILLAVLRYNGSEESWSFVRLEEGWNEYSPKLEILYLQEE